MERRPLLVTLLVVFLALFLDTSRARAYSDFTGIYALIDKVVFEPNAAKPDRIQIWGAFVLASKECCTSYDPPQRGYLYFSCKPGKEDICRKEWADLKATAGTGQVIGFGSRASRPHLRKADEKPADPDEYPLNYGLVKMSDRNSDYAPIRALKSLPREHN